MMSSPNYVEIEHEELRRNTQINTHTHTHIRTHTYTHKHKHTLSSAVKFHVCLIKLFC